MKDAAGCLCIHACSVSQCAAKGLPVGCAAAVSRLHASAVSRAASDRLCAASV